MCSAGRTAIAPVVLTLAIECDAKPDTRTVRRSSDSSHRAVLINPANAEIERISEIHAARPYRDTAGFVNRALRCRQIGIRPGAGSGRDRSVNRGNFP